MAPFSTKKHINTFEYRIYWNISIWKNKFLDEKINGLVVQDEINIQESSINQKSITLIFFYQQLVYKQPALRWQIAKQLSGLKHFLVSNNKNYRLKNSGAFPL